MNTIKDVAVVAAAGAIGVVFFGRPVLRAWRARSWPKVRGEVTKTRIEEVAGRKATRYALRIDYSYEANGATRHGTRFGFFAGQSTFRQNMWAVEAKRKYPVGGKVDVYVDPANPAASVLDTSVPWYWGLSLAFSAVFLVAGTWGILRALL